MQFPTLALLGLAGSALAAPAPQQDDQIPTFGQPFGIEAEGEGLSYAQIRAVNGRLMIGGEQTATCEGGQSQDFATFALYSDKRLYMYTNSNPVQNVWVDASGMGQGITGYSSPDRLGNRFSIEPFYISQEGALTFDNTPAKACPALEKDQYTIWFSNAEKPAYQEGCIEVQLKTYYAPARIACNYTESA
ncbi:hypothetical protein CB0940_10304 [Cercospora beticola]|uniref:Cell wall protein phiA n=1 Tax=Cercospora beticola TaxID=122368 RepID=A0A2G5HSZ7_CERBT|nr:hypothetical protein CB0940_10304 [Cercospora beticola]PIA95656.1 hypothetical protein CB0940_10304 [Cercospora beticola]WPB07014.1 hypothetical protein RHO25_011674 [Cercospora beticola]CAK1366952.1 unnamed protein product [Cercospora beticola]